MSGIPGHWLGGRRAITVGGGAIGDALAQAGVCVTALEPADDAAQIAAAFDVGERELGGVCDLLVDSGADAQDSAPFDPALWRTGMSAQLDGRFLRATEFARRAISAGQGGSIVMLAARPTGPLAAAVDGAIDNLVKTLAVEWARDGIRVNAIVADAPARPALSALIAYLASDYGAYVTGTRMGIDEDLMA